MSGLNGDALSSSSSLRDDPVVIGRPPIRGEPVTPAQRLVWGAIAPLIVVAAIAAVVVAVSTAAGAALAAALAVALAAYTGWIRRSHR
jgi:hypothetical protein